MKISGFQLALLILIVTGVVVAGAAFFSRSMFITSSQLELIRIPLVATTDGIDPDLLEAINQKLTQIEKENAYGSAYLDLSKIYFANGLRQLAQQALLNYTAHCPDETKAWYYLARASHTIGDFTQSAEAYIRTSQLRPDYTPAY